MTASARLGLLIGLLLATSTALCAEGKTGQRHGAPAAGNVTLSAARPLATADKTTMASSSRAAIGQTSIVYGPGAVASHHETSRAPANDNCQNAYYFALYAGSPVTFQDDNTGATEDCAALSGGTYGEAWYKFTTYETLNVVVKYCGTVPAFYNAYIVMDTTCSCSGDFVFASDWEQTSCGDGNWSLYWSALSAGTYYWPLLADSADGYAEGPYTVTFEASVPPPPPECPAGALLYGQVPYEQGGNWGAYTSAVTTQFTYQVYDNFAGVAEKIGDIHWWGLSLFFDPYYGWMLCDPTGMTFEIGFYQDNTGTPGPQVCSYTMTPTVTDVGPFSWAELYYFSVYELVPCCVLGNGWVSIQSQLHPADCAFLWMGSPMGDGSAYQDQGGSLVQLGTDLAFCLTGGDCPLIYGACCDDYTGVCNDNVEWGQCMPPLRFTPDTLCGDLTPVCGVRGACCDAGLVCQFTGFESDCDAIQGRFFPGETCPEWVCPADCEHRIDLRDCYGDGWNGNTLDVLVNGETVLSQITLPSGTGPLSFYFTVATSDVIQTIYYPIGGWPYEPYYFIYNNLGTLLGSDGIQGSNCYVQPTGITVTASCHWCPGACCYYDGGCEQTYPDGCFDGEFLGQHTQCSDCPCLVPCPPEGIPEPEPCGEDTDGGCGMEVPTFAPIACGETVCGTTWADTSLRDTDWYQLINPNWACYIWTVEQQIPVLIVLMQAGPNDCTDATILFSATAGECAPATIGPTASLPPGKYWFWVGPSQWSDWPCEQHYTATLTCQDCPPDYCLAGASYCDEYISRVQIDTIDNPSGCETGQYANYTYEQTGWQAMLAYGAATTLTVTNGNPIWFADVCSVWIDWNQDVVFDDDTESVDDITGVGPYVFHITPPDTALPGPTRMRIRIDYANSNPQPCGTTTYGEVEDYTVNVTEVPGACCWSNGTCTQELPSVCGGYYAGPFTQCAGADCNGNGVDDFCDIASGYSSDCNQNAVPDDCEPWQDCNSNGVHDFCDIANGDSEDCNENWIPDECDVDPTDPDGNGQVSADCQGDLVPDECQLAGGLALQIDDGTSENNWGLTAGGELCWINRFAASPAGNVKAIGVTFGSPSYPGSAGVDAGDPLRVYVWSDPNGDGSPVDAVFLGEATGTVDAGSIDTDVVQAVEFPGNGIPVNGSFFIGASVVTTSGYPAAADDDGQTQVDQGFLTFNSIPFDPTDLSNLYPMSLLGYPTTVFILRTVGAGGGDCNSNGRPDQCDVPPICQGPDCSLDCNGNLIPDECEPDCNNNGRPDDCDIACGDSLDCNGNRVPDECDLASGTSQDCNGNGLLDECDIAYGTSQDCQPNGIPDECDIAAGSCDCQPDGIPDECQLWTGASRNLLLWDDGSSENSLGLTAGGELCWITHFTGASMVWAIQACFGTPLYPGSSGVDAGQPFRVYVWSDPNGDGNPADAVFLSEATGVVDGGSIDTDVFQAVWLNLPVNGSFFVGASVVTTSGYPAPMDENGPQYNQAWIVFNTVPFDPLNLGTQLYNMTDIGYPCNWLLRAEVIPDGPCMPNDCNGNGVPDECDIGIEWGGECASPGANCFPAECSSDWDHNGVPDGCETCGDLDSDDDVDLDDYWMFLDAFGTCVGQPKYNAAADMDHDGCVTLVDYQAWRMCYLLANGKEFVAPKPKPMPKPAKKAS